jgi:tetratricopeptide (TPR) repeat protein
MHQSPEAQAEELLTRAKRAEEDGRPDEALSLTDQLLALGDTADPRLVPWFAKALNVRARVLSTQGRVDEELGARAVLVDRYGASASPELQRSVAISLYNSAFALAGLGRWSEALERLDALIAREADGAVNPGDLPDPPQLFRARALGELGRTEESLAALDGHLGESQLAEQRPPREVAWALQLKAQLLSQARRREAQLGTLEEIERRFGASEDPVVAETVAVSMHMRAEVLCDLGRPDEALEVWHRVVERFLGSPPPGEPWVALDALSARRHVLDQLGRWEAAREVCDTIVATFGRSEDPYAQVGVADALVTISRADAAAQDRGAEAAVLLELAERYGDAPEADVRAVPAGVLGRLVWLLGALGRYEEARAALGQASDRLERETQPELVDQLARELVEAAYGIPTACGGQELTRALDVAAARTAEAPEPTLRAIAAKALALSIVAFGGLEQPLEAGGALDRLIQLGDVALETLDELIADEPAPATPIQRHRVLTFTLARIAVLQELGREADARACLNGLDHLLPDEGTPERSSADGLIERARDALSDGIE